MNIAPYSKLRINDKTPLYSSGCPLKDGQRFLQVQGPVTKQLSSNNLNNVESLKFTWQMKCRSRLVFGANTLSQ